MIKQGLEGRELGKVEPDDIHKSQDFETVFVFIFIICVFLAFR